MISSKKKKRRFGGRRDEVRGPVQLASRLTPRQQQYDVRPDEEKGGPDRFVFRFLFFGRGSRSRPGPSRRRDKLVHAPQNETQMKVMLTPTQNVVVRECECDHQGCQNCSKPSKTSLWVLFYSDEWRETCTETKSSPMCLYPKFSI